MSPIDRVLQARTARELFGETDAEAEFKKLQRQVHPDLNPDRSTDATAAFVRLSELYKLLSKATEPSVFVTKKGSWSASASDVWTSSGVRYRALTGTEESWIAYVSNPAATGPFVEGHRNLENLLRETLEEDLRNTTTHSYFLPRVLDKFKLGDQRKEARVLSAELPGTRWFPLSLWTSMAPEDIAWIARRGLIALDIVHKHGYLHGSPHLEAFLIEPEQHGVMLKDWQYSVRQGDPLQLVDMRAKNAYPKWAKEVNATRDGRIDLMVFGHAFDELCKMSSAPPWLREVFQQLQSDPPKKAVDALRKLTEVLDNHWPRKYHPMAYPY